MPYSLIPLVHSLQILPTSSETVQLPTIIPQPQLKEGLRHYPQQLVNPSLIFQKLKCGLIVCMWMEDLRILGMSQLKAKCLHLTTAKLPNHTMLEDADIPSAISDFLNFL